MKKILFVLLVSLILSPVSVAKNVEYTPQQLAIQEELAKENYKLKKSEMSDLIKDKKNDIIKRFLDAGFDVNDKYYASPFTDWAITYKNLEALELFIEYGADINAKIMGYYLLDSAIYSKNKEAAKYLYDKGAKISDYNVESLSKLIDINEIEITKKMQQSKLLKSKDYYILKDSSYVFMPLPKEEVEKLSKEEKSEYKILMRANKHLENARAATYDYAIESNYLSALRLNPDLDIAKYELGAYYHKIGKTAESQIYLTQYLENNTSQNTFHKKALGMMSVNYFVKKEYGYALNTSKQVYNLYKNQMNNNQKYLIQDIIAHSAFAITNKKYEKSQDYLYNTALEFANKNIVCGEKEYIKNAHIIKYAVYMKQNKKNLANKEAKELVRLDESCINYLRLAYSSATTKEQLENYYKAKQHASNQEELIYCMNLITNIEQSKLETIVKSLGFYTKTPDWKEILYLGYKYGSINYWSLRQDKFYSSINNCVKNYSGKNLSACFNQVLVDEEKETEALRFERAIANQEELMYLQRMTNVHLSEIASLQIMSNYYDSQILNYQKKIYFGY